MPTVAASPRPVGPRRFRKSVETLTPQQLTALRQGIAAMKELSDDRGFNAHAGVHGLPLPQLCVHGSELFLPWHRAYLYFFELALQDRVAGAVLPWWDWTSPASRSQGIPDAFAARRAGRGENPLRGAAIPPVARVNGQPRATSRQPGPPPSLPTRAQVDRLLALNDFLDFSFALEDLHGRIHIWVNGTMGMVEWAAYDPIFWAHHTMIDRLWRLWQLRHPRAGLDPALRRQALPPFRMTVEQTLDVKALGYDYAVATAHAGGTR